ncbi:MAG: glycosyltransferase [Bacteroidales bacterium]|nr:glycosyltransferase [Bacteroidales bacterium]
MAIPEILYYVLIGFFGAVYMVILIYYTIGWYKLKPFKYHESNNNTRVSVIVPARNEENNITELLENLINQNYPSELCEIIIVDDNSTDQTVSLVNKLIKEKSNRKIRLLSMKSDEYQFAYKKKAISMAIDRSDGELIITTDADCNIKPDWIKSLVSYYELYKPKMIVGMVSYHNERTFFEKMQTLEFLSLIAITGGAISIGKPIMSNGANLAYEKKAFIEVNGFGEDRFSSGDDVFLLLKIRKKFGNNSVRFLKSFESLVFTEAKKSLGEFMHQRTRWASKNKGYESNILLVSFTVYMVNLLLLAGFFLGIWIPYMYINILLLFLIKIIFDLPILVGIITFVKRQNILFYGLPLIILYPVYIVITGAMGIVSSYQWKGRKITN